MKTRNMRFLVGFVVAVGFLAGQHDAKAVAITVDQILADPVSGTLSGTVNMTVSGNVLTITLKNTSDTSDSGAGVLLTGIAFKMNGGLDIVSGTVQVGPNSTIIGGSLNGSGPNTFVNGEWGYDNGVSGHFNGLAVDTQVSTMQADTDTPFGAPIDNPAVLAGPDYGILAAGDSAGGLNAIQNCVIIKLTLSGTPNGGFLNSINNGLVALTFGSPSGGTSTSVPDSGATVGLLGLAMLGIAGLRRKLAKRA